MKIYSASEQEIDRRLALDKRKSQAAFCKGFESESELPVGFYDLQDKIREGLEREFFISFGDGIDRSNIKPWKSSSHKFFYFPAELISSERIVIELSVNILNDKVLGVILRCLEKWESKYCVIAAVFLGTNIVGSNYLGRFVVNLDEIVVESSIVKIWSTQMQFLEIDTIGLP